MCSELCSCSDIGQLHYFQSLWCFQWCRVVILHIPSCTCVSLSQGSYAEWDRGVIGRGSEGSPCSALSSSRGSVRVHTPERESIRPYPLDTLCRKLFWFHHWPSICHVFTVTPWDFNWCSGFLASVGLTLWGLMLIGVPGSRTHNFHEVSCFKLPMSWGYWGHPT